jgi:uncharacterized protein YprB with RNaseH-like and TPR domain
MSNVRLREQLRRLGLRQGTAVVNPQPKRQRQAIEELLSGEVVDTGLGSFFLHREIYEAGHRHGHHTLADLPAQPREITAYLARDDRLAGVDHQRIAFLDTETTGLAGGTGTYAFLVGVGVFEGDRFAIHQFFMRDYDEEVAQIQVLGELLDGMDAVVTFNGKSFDLPLLETRFIMTRQPPRLVGVPHLDLLPVARRLWKYRLDSCALSSLEEEVLGVQRTHADVPGWLIPSLYAEYARTGDAREMPRIFYHNAQDILSLVTLTVRQGNLLASCLPFETSTPGEDLYGLGRLLHDLGQLDRAEVAFTQAARTSQSARVREMAMRDLAYLLKRQERRGEALAWWQQLVERAEAVYACEELAKHCEWQDQDLAQALAWTRQGITLVRALPHSPGKRTTLEDLQHRRRRLEHKLELLEAEDK